MIRWAKVHVECAGGTESTVLRRVQSSYWAIITTPAQTVTILKSLLDSK